MRHERITWWFNHDHIVHINIGYLVMVDESRDGKESYLKISLDPYGKKWQIVKESDITFFFDSGMVE